MKKFLSWLNSNKKAVALTAVFCLCSIAMAQETGGESGMQQVSDKFEELITQAIPILIGLFTAAISIFGIFIGIKWLKKTLKQGAS